MFGRLISRSGWLRIGQGRKGSEKACGITKLEMAELATLRDLLFQPLRMTDFPFYFFPGLTPYLAWHCIVIYKETDSGCRRVWFC